MSKTFGIAFTVGAALAPSVASVFSTVEQKIQAGASRMDALTARAKVFKSIADLDTRRKDLGRLNAASGGQDPLIKEQLFKAQASYSAACSAAAKYGKNVTDYGKAHAFATAEIAKTEAALKRHTAQKQLADKRQELRGRMMDSVAPVMGVALPVKAAINFESAMADAAKTIDGMRDDSGNLTKEYYALENTVKAMGRELPLTHEQLAGIFAAGGQIGLQSADELKEFTTMAAHMSVAFGVSTDEAADAIGGYRTAMHLSFAETRNMLDLMNQFANTGSASEKGIAEIVRRIGSLGNVAGVTYKPMTALAATLDSMKVAPEVAATGIKNMLLALTSGSAATKMQEAAMIKLKINPAQLAKDMQKDGQAAILKVLERIKGLDKHEQLSVLKRLFGSESIAAIAPLLDSLDLVKENMAISADETKYAAAMQKEFENRSKTTANALILAKNRVVELGINIGSVLLPPLVTVLDIVGGGVSIVAEFAAEHKTLTTAVMGVAFGYTAFKTATLAAAYGSTFLRGALMSLPVLMRLVGVASQAMLGPIGLVTAGLALGAGYIVENWETVGPFFTGLWNDLTSSLSDLGGAFGAAIDTVIIEPVKTVMGWIESLLEMIGKIPLVGDAFKSIGGIVGDGFKGLKKMFGIKAEIAGPVMPEAVAKARAQEGLTAKTPKTEPVTPPQSTAIARQNTQKEAGLKGTPSSEAEEDVMPKAEGKKQRAPKKAKATSESTHGVSASAAPTPAVSVSTAINCTFNGIPDADFASRVVTAIDARKSDVERLLSDIVNNQVRLAYGG